MRSIKSYRIVKHLKWVLNLYSLKCRLYLAALWWKNGISTDLNFSQLWLRAKEMWSSMFVRPRPSYRLHLSFGESNMFHSQHCRMWSQNVTQRRRLCLSERDCLGKKCLNWKCETNVEPCHCFVVIRFTNPTYLSLGCKALHHQTHQSELCHHFYKCLWDCNLTLVHLCWQTMVNIKAVFVSRILEILTITWGENICFLTVTVMKVPFIFVLNCRLYRMF